MAKRFSFGNRLLRAALSLGFLGCLLAGIFFSQAATSDAGMGANGATLSFCSQFANLNDAYVPAPRDVLTGSTHQADAFRFNGPNSIPAGQVETGKPEEFDVALEDEDPIETFRIDTQQRTFGSDRVGIGPKIASKAAPNTRPNISPPLLV